MPLPPRSRLGPYDILGLLGTGGMGEVYRARDTRLGRDVAIKVLPDHAASDATWRKRFEQEARAASALNHPNICTIHNIEQQDGAPYIVMELLKGTLLRDALRGGPLALPQLLHLATQVADALEAAHSAGIIHRDLTPSNIFITSRGDAKVLDFGLVKLHTGPDQAPSDEASTAAAESPLTAAGRMLGTPGYASPEQTLGLPLDRRSDLFSFGVVLYEMATGRRAFSGESPALAGDAVVHASPLPLVSLNPLVPAGLARVVDKAIEKDPALRYQSAAELKADLRRLMRDAAGDPAPESAGHLRPPGAAPPPSDPARWRPRPVTVLVTLVLVAAGAVAYLVYEGRREDRKTLPDSVPNMVTSGSYVAIEPALSPDGHKIAYVVDEGTEQSIWMSETRGNPGTPWTKTKGRHRHPSWSLDDRIFFESGTGEARGIYQAPSLDSAQATLIVKGGREPAVSPDGRRLAFVAAGGAGYTRIGVTDTAPGSAVTQLTQDGDGLWDHSGPTWSLDGRLICYAAHDGLWLVPAAGGGAPTQLSKGTDAHPAWSGSGFIYFSSLRGGAWQLWRIAPGGTAEAQRVTQGVDLQQMPVVSQNGRVLAFSTVADEAEIVIRDLSNGAEAPIGGGGYKNFPAFGRHAGSIVFWLNAWNRRSLFVQDLAGGRPAGSMRQLMADARDPERAVTVSQPAVSPDGRWVAFLEIDGEAREIWIMPASGGPRVNVTNHPAADYLPTWDPDSGRLAFVSERDGEQHVWIQDVRNGQPVGAPARLSTGSAAEFGPTWSPDGRRIALVTESGTASEVAIADVARPSSPVVVTRGARAQGVRWTARRGWLLIAGQWSSDRFALRAFDADRREFLRGFAEVDLGSNPQGLAFDISQDERYLALVRVTRSGRVGVLEARTGRY